MTATRAPEPPPEVEAPDQEQAQTGGHESHGGHSHWMMVACCLPMLIVAVVLVATGAGAGALLFAVGCTAMMSLMMFGMMRG